MVADIAPDMAVAAILGRQQVAGPDVMPTRGKCPAHHARGLAADQDLLRLVRVTHRSGAGGCSLSGGADAERGADAVRLGLGREEPRGSARGVGRRAGSDGRGREALRGRAEWRSVRSCRSSAVRRAAEQCSRASGSTLPRRKPSATVGNAGPPAADLSPADHPDGCIDRRYCHERNPTSCSAGCQIPGRSRHSVHHGRHNGQHDPQHRPGGANQPGHDPQNSERILVCPGWSGRNLAKRCAGREGDASFCRCFRRHPRRYRLPVSQHWLGAPQIHLHHDAAMAR
jgi:hypothetical protein